jgi:hypothetical protein
MRAASLASTRLNKHRDKPRTMALKSFNPDTLLENWSDEKYNPIQSGKPLAQCVREAFGIPSSDSYVYRAQGETTLDITQRVIAAKDANGLHDWYHDDDRKLVRCCLSVAFP